MSNQAPAAPGDAAAVPDVPGVPGALWCWPGPRAKVTFINENRNDRLLVIFCDPFSLILTVPPGPAGPDVMVGLLRQLAREAAEMAAVVESDSHPVIRARWGRP